jgi:hypothetical protein
MDRLARLLPFRQFGRLRHLRGIVPCAPLDVAPAPTGSHAARFEQSAQQAGTWCDALPSSLPAFARVSLNSALHADAPRRAPVRVYHSASRLVLVGTIDAVCRMIDRCIDEERSGLQRGLFD